MSFINKKNQYYGNESIIEINQNNFTPLALVDELHFLEQILDDFP